MTNYPIAYLETQNAITNLEFMDFRRELGKLLAGGIYVSDSRTDMGAVFSYMSSQGEVISLEARTTKGYECIFGITIVGQPESAQESVNITAEKIRLIAPYLNIQDSLTFRASPRELKSRLVISY